MLSDFITNCVHKVAKNEGFIDYKIETTAGSKHGDNFLGIMTAITVSGKQRKNGIINQQSLYLICKAPPLNEIRKKNWKSNLVFEREIYIYTKLLPTFVRFQREKGLSEADSFLSFPKVYKCEVSEEHDTYLLIMEDLRVKNYEMWPKEKMIALDHEMLALKELAKFHAISFAMQDQRPNEFEQFKQLTDVSMEILMNGFGSVMSQSMDRLVDVLENPQHKKLVENFRTRYMDVIEKILTESESTEHAVIRHGNISILHSFLPLIYIFINFLGDFWNNNFMFQYSSSNGNVSDQEFVKYRIDD